MQGRWAFQDGKLKKDLGATVAACEPLGGGSLFQLGRIDRNLFALLLGIGRAGRLPLFRKSFTF